jgi:hypothetical protein
MVMSSFSISELKLSSVPRPGILLVIGDSCTRLDQIAHMGEGDGCIVLVLTNGVEVELDPPAGMTALEVIRRFRMHMTFEGVDLTAPVGGDA